MKKAEKIEVIEVSERESALVRKADELERAAWQKAKEAAKEIEEARGESIIIPALFFDSAQDAQIVYQRDMLANQYQRDLDLSCTPVLVPAPSAPLSISSHAFPHTPEAFHRYHRDPKHIPLPEEIKDRFVQIVPVFRDGERLFLWEGTHFQFKTDNEVKARIKSVLRHEFYIPQATALLSNILSLLKAEEQIVGKPDSVEYLVAVKNGEVDLRNMTLHAASPLHHLTHYLDVPWMEWQPCPVFNEFLDYAAGGDPEWKQRTLETLGFLLVSDNRAKRFVVFQGEGDCGKSVLGNLISSFFEPGSCAALADFQFGERFAMASIANCHLCSCMDLSGGVIDGKAVSMLKQITGGDLVSIEAKGKDAYAGYIRCKVLFGTNASIKLKTRDKAFARRLLLIPFRYPVPDHRKDRDLLNKLKAERSGILHLALCAYQNVVARGYTFSGEARFGFTADQIELETAPVNAVAVFSAQYCEVDAEYFTPTEELHLAYLQMCTRCGFLPIADRAAFSRALNSHLKGTVTLEKRRIDGIPTNGFQGLKLRGE